MAINLTLPTTQELAKLLTPAVRDGLLKLPTASRYLNLRKRKALELASSNKKAGQTTVKRRKADISAADPTTTAPVTAAAPLSASAKKGPAMSLKGPTQPTAEKPQLIYSKHTCPLCKQQRTTPGHETSDACPRKIQPAKIENADANAAQAEQHKVDNKLQSEVKTDMTVQGAVRDTADGMYA
ncbi:hypothetical protein EJ03DRAFT_354386 [Teratosphaeria nubilosa]|uniref:Uncharacterized protein n=1 Tax=Teratosphaeria nubilosa TaxID=161662 RepID=A0A6G1L086_9PEZI|nr:hypothetical protein EJ03DRAFT_354386 [Teratosphaeria nubilosa]